MESKIIIWDKVAKKESYQINSVVKAFQVIECLTADKEQELSVLAKRLEFPKTTTHRILQTLESLGYVERTPSNNRYRTSLKFLEIGGQVADRMDFIEIAHPFMQKLASQTGETVNLGILDGLEMICVDKIKSEHALSHDQPLGSRHKAYCTGFGKAVLAFLTNTTLAGLLEGHTILADTPKSVRSKIDLEADLLKVRKKGYSVDNEEGSEGIRCVGAPIFNHEQRVIAGLSVAGPSQRIKMENVSRLGKLVKDTANTISRKLGAV